TAELLMTTKEYNAARLLLDELNDLYPNAYQAKFLSALLFDIQGQKKQAIRQFSDITKAQNPYTKTAKLFLIINDVEVDIPDMQQTDELVIRHFERALFQLASGNSQRFLTQLEKAISNHFATEYLLQSQSLLQALLQISPNRENAQQAFSQIQQDLHNINQL